MKVIHDIKDFHPSGPVYLTQGTFDGVHVGHKEILSRLVSEAKAANGVSVLLTFWPHPRLVLFPEDNDLKMINTMEEKNDLMAKLGLDFVIILPFTRELSRTRAEDFTRDVLVGQLGVDKLIIGYDHRFGKNREGTLEKMIRLSNVFDFEVQEIPAQDVDESIISSTKIRQALLNGEITLANQLLGHNFNLSGTVIKGSQRGQKLGYPTANIEVSEPVKLIPKTGVYAVRITIGDEEFSGMLNIGYNPTFMNNKLSVEVHIFDFSKDLYDKTIKITFYKRVRDEIRFNGPQQLKTQLKADEKEIREIFG